ncbi:MAG: Uma2 family endonuclease [Lachnospiraceae bacterium]|nr:Uma2 family endonuclease [Lachnospiraceae bacterium]
MDDKNKVKEPKYSLAKRADFPASESARLLGEKMIDRLKYPRQGEYTIADIMQMPDGTDVDLIEGVIYDRGEVTLAHQEIEGFLSFKFREFIEKDHGGCHVWTDKIDIQLQLDDDSNFLQPDVLVLCDDSKISDDGGYIIGGPDLVVEVISPSTRKRDMTVKVFKYMGCGVREYWIVDPYKRKVIVFDFANDDLTTYTFDEKVPVGIWDKQLIIDFSDLKDRLARI